MFIGIDGNEANQNIRVGVGQYAYNLLLELYRQRQNDQYYIFLKQKPLADLPPKTNNWHYLVFGPQKLWTKIALPLHLLLSSVKLDLFYSPSHYSPSFSPFPTIPTIHDIGYLKYQDQFTKKDLYQLINWTKASLDKAIHIIAVSEFTKNELIKTYQTNPKNISIISNGVGQIPLPKDDIAKKTLNKFKIYKPYFLALGTLKPNKNYPFLINSFIEFSKKHPDYQLVIAGKKGWLYQEIENLLNSQKISNKVIFTDYITDNEKWVLLNKALSLVIPSTYEGFGIPAIESLKMNTPVISSDIPSLREVLGETPLYIDPYKSNTLVSAMNKVLDKNTRLRLVKNGQLQIQKFTWANSAKRLISLFHQISSLKNV